MRMKRDRRRHRQKKLKLRGTSTRWPPPWTTLPDTPEAIERGEKAAPRPDEAMTLVPIGGRLVAVPSGTSDRTAQAAERTP